MHPLILSAFILGNSLDLASTHYAMNNGGVEGMLPNNLSAIYGIKITSTLVGSIALNKLHVNHPKIANGLAFVIGSEMSIIAYHNVKIIRDSRK